LAKNSGKFLKTNSKKTNGPLLKKIWKTGSTDQRHKNGRLKHAGTEDNVIAVDEAVGLINHEDQKQTHLSTRLLPIIVSFFLHLYFTR